MALTKTSDQIIYSVKMRAMLPTDSATFSTEDYLDIINEEFLISMVPNILKYHEEYYVYEHRIPITSGTKRYVIPHRAIGTRCRDVKLEDGNGNLMTLTRIAPEVKNENTINSNAFYIENDQVVFLTEPTGTNVLMSIFLRPNELVESNRGATITAIDTTTGVLTLSAVPSHFGSNIDLSLPEPYDFVSKNSPYKIRSYDINAVSVDSAAKTITFTASDLPTDLVVGDYLTWAEESIVPQLPVELISLLSQRAAIYCLESIGDSEGLALAERKLQKLEEAAGMLIDNRIVGTPQKIVNRNSPLYKNNKGYRSGF